MSDTMMFGPIEVDTTGRWPDHLVTIEGDYGVTCRCGAILAWPGGWNHNETSAARLVAFHATLSSPETTPAGVLDEAWAAAEKALPEGWQVTGLDRDGSRWIALAERIEDLPFGGHVPGNPGTSVPGPTPAAALHALAAALGRSGSGGGRG